MTGLPGTTVVKFQLRAGRLRRVQVRTALRGFCFANSYELDLEEESSWISTWFGVRITVPADEREEVIETMENWIKANSDRQLRGF